VIELATAAVDAALAAGASAAEAYASSNSGREVRVHDGSVESLTAATQRGIGVRAWIGQRAGYAYGTDLSSAGMAEVSQRAVVAAGIADEDEFAGPVDAPGEPSADLELHDPGLSEWTPSRVAELALAVERSALDFDARIAAVEQAVYADSAEQVAIVTSSGIAGEYESSSCHAYATALAEGDGGSGRETGLGFGVGRGPAELDPEAIGCEAGERAAAMVGAGKPSSRSCPVVLDATVAASFATLLGKSLAANAVQRGRSPLADSLGERVGSEALNLHDDGLDPRGMASAPFDGEGTPRRRTPLIEDGTLLAFLYDGYTARRGGVGSTANAGRSGYRSQPSVAPSNLIVATGSLGFEQLLGEAGDGVCVTDVAGLHSGVNPVTGVFSVGAAGRAIRNGALAEPLREFTVASDLVSMLKAIRATGSIARWVPFGVSVCTPPLLIGEMAISGS
jgi:PmbA protein